MRYPFRTLLLLSALEMLLASQPGGASAQEHADPTGTWTWKFPNQSAIWTLRLLLQGDMLTGSIKHMQTAPERPIEDATFKDGFVVFKLRYRTRFGEEAVATFKGMVSQNTIKGTGHFDRPGSNQSVKWEATREKEQPHQLP